MSTKPAPDSATPFSPDPEVLIPEGETHFIISRTIDAPRELVFRMYTEPHHMVHFWGPHGTTTPVCEVDLRPGGVWHYVMRWPGNQDFAVTSVYLEIAPPERIMFRDAPASMRGGVTGELPAPTMVTTIRLDDVDGRTRVSTTVRMNTVAERDGAIAGGFADTVHQAGERLDAYLDMLEEKR